MNDFAGLMRPTGVTWTAPHSGHVNFGDDSRIVVMFYIHPVLNAVISRDKGTPFYENKIYVMMHEPGERLNIVKREATDNDKMRFPVQWNKFVQNAEQIPDGVRIELLYPNNPAMAEMMRAHGIFTVEQLANLSAHAIDNVGMGAQEHVNLAKRYLEKGSDGAAFHKMKGQLDETNQKLKLLERQHIELMSKHNALIERMTNPLQQSNSPPWVPGHDAQAERLNANHPSSELAKATKPVKAQKEPASAKVDTN